MSDTRTERDSLGEVEVPSSATMELRPNEPDRTFLSVGCGFHGGSLLRLG